jgi:hypothetical protein
MNLVREAGSHFCKNQLNRSLQWLAVLLLFRTIILSVGLRNFVRTMAPDIGLGVSRRTMSVFGKVCIFYMLEVEHVAPPPLIRFLLFKSALIDYV